MLHANKCQAVWHVNLKSRKALGLAGHATEHLRLQGLEPERPRTIKAPNQQCPEVTKT